MMEPSGLPGDKGGVGSGRSLAWRVAQYAAMVAVLAATACRPTEPLRPVVPGDDPASRTAVYLIARGERLFPGAVLVLDYARRKFDLAWAEGLVDSVAQRVSNPEELTTLGIFARIIDPEAAAPLRSSITATIASFEGIPTTHAVLQGLYCDWSPPPPQFLQRIQEPRPGLRHWRVSTLVSYAYLETNGCIGPEDLEAAAAVMHREYGAFLDGIVATGSAPGAEFVETVGGLYFALGRESVAPSWAEYVIEHQQVDGAWNIDSDEEGSEDFTVAWGLVAVLEYMHPDAPPISPIP